MLLAILFDLQFLCADVDPGFCFEEPIVAQDDVIGVGVYDKGVNTDSASCYGEGDFLDYSKSEGFLSIGNGDRSMFCGIDQPFEHNSYVMTDYCFCSSSISYS